MLLLNIVLLALSALPTSLAKSGRHHRSSTSLNTASSFTTLPSTSNATIPITTMSATGTASSPGSPGGLAACPTVTVAVPKVKGICPIALCEPLVPISPVTSTALVSCACPAAMATTTTSVCDVYDACATTTSWVYETTGAC